MAHQAVFLDRDGVLNRAIVVDGHPYAPRTLHDFRLLPNAARQVERLRAAGFRIVVITNQPDIAHRLIDAAELDRMHARLANKLAVDLIKTCPHGQNEGCDCRKPRPGMLLSAAAELGIDLHRSYMIGDRWSDIEAGATAGCITVKIERRYSNERLVRPDAVVHSLRAAVEYIIYRERDYA